MGRDAPRLSGVEVWVRFPGGLLLYLCEISEAGMEMMSVAFNMIQAQCGRQAKIRLHWNNTYRAEILSLIHI